MASDQTVPIPFKQIYQFENVGPSPTNKDVNITIFVPESSMLDPTETEVTIQRENSTCLKVKSTSNFNRGIYGKYSANLDKTPIFCSNSKCFVYQCLVQPHWKSNEIMNITIEQTFLREKANELNIQNLTVITYAQIQSSNGTSMYKLISIFQKYVVKFFISCIDESIYKYIILCH